MFGLSVNIIDSNKIEFDIIYFNKVEFNEIDLCLDTFT